jgi:hypothetical protein
MTRSDEPLFEPRIADWLEDDPHAAPDQALDIVLAAFPSIKQRRASRVPWRFLDMPGSLKLAAAAVAVILAIGGAAWILGRGSGSGVGGPNLATPSATSPATPLPSLSIAPSPTATSANTADWVTFSSTRYGYQIAHPPTWSATPATRPWVLATDAATNTTTAADHFIDPTATYQILLTAFAADVPAGMSEDEWLTTYFTTADAGLGDCGVTVAALVPTTVDGRPGRIRDSSACSDAQAFIFIAGRVHVFGIWREGQRQLLEAFLATVKFDPESPAGSASPSASPG